MAEPNEVRKWMEVWAAEGLLSREATQWLLAACETVLVRHAGEVCSVWPRSGLVASELLASFMARHGDGREFARMTLERSTTVREAAGYVFVALENQFQDLVRDVSPRRRLHRRLREGAKNTALIALKVHEGGAGLVLEWSSEIHLGRPERIDDAEGRFSSELVLRAACHYLGELERPVEIGELVDILGDAYGVPETSAEGEPEGEDFAGSVACEPSRSTACVRDDVADAVLAFRASLPARDREILDQYVTGRSLGEIARATGRAKSTVSEAIDRRLIPALRDKLEPLVESTGTVRSAMALLEATVERETNETGDDHAEPRRKDRGDRDRVRA